MHPDFITHDLTIAPDALGLIDREWLITNGAGGFAMGTVPGINTRRYHALLVAAAKPPVARVVALNQVLEQVFVGAEKIEFTTCLFRDPAGADVPVPGGCAMLQRFRRGLSVEWTYTHARVELVRELHLHWKQPAATIHYRIRPGAGAGAGDKLVLRLAPMLALRDFHALTQKDRADVVCGVPAADAVTVRRGEMAVTLRSPGSRFVGQSNWWYGLHYPVETERGQDDAEDVFIPGYFEIALDSAKESQVVFTAALGEHAAPPADANDTPRLNHLRPLAERLAGFVEPSPPGSGQGEGAPTRVQASTAPSPPATNHTPPDPGPLPMGAGGRVGRTLALASDDFVVDRFFQGQKLATIIAGYPWFADWGRDTFIALPGLLLTPGRLDEARSCLRTFANVIRDGLVPNVFSDHDDTAASYNTVDASLWFVHAAMQYVQASGDHASWNDWLAAACVSIIEGYIKGTTAGEGGAIRMAGDGLITAGSASTQLTWMDAACGGRVFTPRQGKAVEINALWYHVLTGMAEMFESVVPGDRPRAQHYTKIAGRISRSFAKVFWDEKGGYLRDHVWTDDAGQEHFDTALRPNQIFAASLPHSPIPRTRQLDVVKAVRERLLTPVGLRTLPVDDADYHGTYTGSQMSRDEAYHQGTIWPWLIGPYGEAVLRVGKFSDRAKTEAREALAPLLAQMVEAGPGASLGQLHEVHEAQPPHRPVGCIAQAWSVAEVIRLLAMCV